MHLGDYPTTRTHAKLSPVVILLPRCLFLGAAGFHRCHLHQHVDRIQLGGQLPGCEPSFGLGLGYTTPPNARRGRYLSLVLGIARASPLADWRVGVARVPQAADVHLLQPQRKDCGYRHRSRTATQELSAHLAVGYQRLMRLVYVDETIYTIGLPLWHALPGRDRRRAAADHGTPAINMASNNSVWG